MNNDRLPALKLRKWLMRNKESTLPGLMLSVTSYAHNYNNTHWVNALRASCNENVFILQKYSGFIKTRLEGTPRLETFVKNAQDAAIVSFMFRVV